MRSGGSRGKHTVFDKGRPDAQIATYTYDALGRRIRERVANGGLPGEKGTRKGDILLF